MQRSRMTPPPPRQYYQAARSRPWPMVSWWYSLLFVLPLVILLGMGIASLFGSDGPSKTIEVTVTDQASGRPLQGAVVSVGAQRVDTNQDGLAVVDRPENDDYLIVQAVGYEPTYGVITDAIGKNQSIALLTSTFGGVVLDANGQALSGATVTVLQDGEPIPKSATSATDGTWSLQNVPSGALVRITADGYATMDIPVTEATSITMTVAPTEATAEPTADTAAQAEDDDTSGSAAAVDRSGLPPVPEMVRGIYVSAHSAANSDTLDSIIQFIQDTELNAVVLDIKEDYVWYDTGVSFFQDANAVDPIYDVQAVLAKFDAAGIYTIARLVVFKDPIVAENRPDLSVKDDNGGLWRGWQGEAWVNPFFEELWDANIALAVEAAQFGFDEIQYDYVRFPSDGDLMTANFEHGYTMDDRVSAISGFLDESHEQINEAGAWLAADVFGIVALYDDDQGIGQYLRELYLHVDFVCPMIYPSHFDSGSIYVGEDGLGEPNDYPYDVIEISLAGAIDKMNGEAGKLRPWLQDFSLGGMTPYGPDEVRAQIDATEASGASGWMLWNSGGGTNNAAGLNGP